MNENLFAALRSVIHPEIEVHALNHVGGGSINSAWRADTSKGKWFIKSNSATAFPNMFQRESNGLTLLSSHSKFHAPIVAETVTIDNEAFIIMDWIEQGPKAPNFWKKFAENLVHLHNQTHKLFGLGESNYIGSLVQSNDQKPDWPTFFIEKRILPMVKLACDQGTISPSEALQVEKVVKHASEFFPQETPSLLHGDLWSGNFMCDQSGRPTLFDPAVYYGHRLMDLGMMRLFGGFDEAVFEHYHALYPLEPNWKIAAEFANLYPLLVHLNLFGRSYWTQIKSTLKHLRLA